MTERNELPFLGSLDSNESDKTNYIGSANSAENRIIKQMLADEITFARATIHGRHVIVKVVELGSDPELNVHISGSLEKGIWRAIEIARNQILRAIDPDEWAKQRRLAQVPFGIPSNEPPKLQTPPPAPSPPPITGEMIKRTPDTQQQAHPLKQLFDEVQPPIIGMPSSDGVLLSSTSGILQIQAQDFLSRLDNTLDSMRRGGIIHGQRHQIGSRSLQCTYDGIRFADIEPFLKQIGALPTSNVIQHVVAIVYIEINFDNSFKNFTIRLEKA